MMKGLELSRIYFEEYGKQMMTLQLAQYRPYMAVGLVGEGSECLGFDDEISHGSRFRTGILYLGTRGDLHKGGCRDAEGI